MKEKLAIKNFGPIKDVELDLRSINIFIGDQGTGKSTIAKLLIAIKNNFLLDIFSIPDDKINRITEVFLEHLNLVGIRNYILESTEIIFSDSNKKFSFKNNKVEISEKIPSKVELTLGYDFTYIPAERDLVITLSDSLYALMQTDTALPKLFLRFGNKFQRARQNKESFNYKDILGVTYEYIDSRDYIILSNGKKIPIQDSSSGIHGAVALLTVFDYVMLYTQEGNLIVIEEPELSSFPETQYKLIKHFFSENKGIDIAGRNYLKNDILITTHSPYVLTSLNNMIYAFTVGKNHKDLVSKIVEEKYWINPDDVAAYMLFTNGSCENIFDREENLIKADKIDGVSSFLNEQFDRLVNIELANS